MTEVEYHRSLYDPPKPKGLFGVPPHVLIGSIVVVSLLFGVLAFYFINAQFKLREVNYSDDSVDVELIEPIPPPPKEDRIASTIPPGRIDGPVTIPLPPPPPKPTEIVNPSWSRQPSGEFPERAMSRGVERGTVVLNCLVAPSGSMSDCRIVSEDPSGMGFGREAINGTRRARLSPRTVDGAATGARVTFTTRFQAPD